MAYALALLTFLAITFGVVALATIWRGYVLSVVWGWLVVPMFHFQPITVLGAIIISMIVGFLVAQHSTCQQDPEKSGFGYGLWISFLYPGMVLFVAWVIKGFI